MREFVKLVVNVVKKKKTSERLANLGIDLVKGIAKAARLQTAASNVKPWPWTELY